MVGLPAPFIPHSASLCPAMATRVLSAPAWVSAPPTSLDECLFFISLVSDFLAIRFSVSSGCARRCSVSTYATFLVLGPEKIFKVKYKSDSFFSFLEKNPTNSRNFCFWIIYLLIGTLPSTKSIFLIVETESTTKNITSCRNMRLEFCFFCVKALC